MTEDALNDGPLVEEPLTHRSPKTVNNVLTALSALLKKAVEWGELERLPCTIKLLANPKKTMGFHDFQEYERLLAVAQRRAARRTLWVAGRGSTCWARGSVDDLR